MGKIRIIRGFTRLQKEDKKIVIECIIYTGLYRFILLFYSFNRIAPMMGKHRTSSPMEINEEDMVLCRKVGAYILKVSRSVPWKCECFVKALVVQRILAKRSIATTLYLGVKRDRNNDIQGHAWLRAGKYIITGDKEKDEFVEVGRFSNYEIIPLRNKSWILKNS